MAGGGGAWKGRGNVVRHVKKGEEIAQGGLSGEHAGTTCPGKISGSLFP